VGEYLLVLVFWHAVGVALFALMTLDGSLGRLRPESARFLYRSAEAWLAISLPFWAAGVALTFRLRFLPSPW
jgi:hypothetical protein